MTERQNRPKSISFASSIGSLDAWVYQRNDEEWTEYFDGIGLSEGFFETIRNSDVSRIGYICAIEVHTGARGNGIGTAILSKALERFEQAGADIVLLFADMEEENGFDLVSWYERHGFERADNAAYAPLMAKGDPELIAELRRAMGHREDLEPTL